MRTRWRLWSKNGTDQFCKAYGKPKDDQWGVGEFDSPQDFLKDDELNKNDDGTREYTEAYVIPATPQEDRKAETEQKKN